MPKELVFGDSPPYTDASSARSVVGVHWSHDGYMQLSTMLFNDDGKYLTADGLVHQSEGVDAERRQIWSEGFYVSLNRQGINLLIRNLRRARDQAFGRDE